MSRYRRSNSARLSVESLDDRIVPAAKFSIGDAYVLEGNVGSQNAILTVTLTGAHGNNTTVNYTTANESALAGSDYTAVSGKLTFGKNETTKTIQVPILGDRLPEWSESFSVVLSNAKGAKIDQGTGYVYIEDDEPRAYVNAGGAVEGNSGTTPMTVRIWLTKAYDIPVTVNYTTADGTAVAGVDYVATSGTVTILPGQTYQEVSVPIIGDRVLEADESFAVNITSPNSYVAIGSSGVQTIADNEPRISVGDTYLDYDTGTFTFYVYLQNDYDQPVTVDFATADGSAVAGIDYVYTSGTLTFEPGQTFLQVTVSALNLYPDNYYPYFALNLTNPSANAQIVAGTGYGYWWYYDPWW